MQLIFGFVLGYILHDSIQGTQLGNVLDSITPDGDKANDEGGA